MIRLFFIPFCFLLLLGYEKEHAVKIPAARYDIEEVIFNRSNSLWLLKKDSSKLSGTISRYFPDGTLAERLSVLEGRKEGVQLSYFADGSLKFSESFRNNRLSGEVKRWTLEDGYSLLAQLNYQEGKLHGEQRKWYSTGELHKHLNLNSGIEEGLQCAYRKNGALYANYEARDGKVYGLKRANLCYELDNEKVVYQR